MQTSEDSEWYKIDHGGLGESLELIYNQFGIIQFIQRSPIPQTSNWSGTFFAVSYSKLALFDLHVKKNPLIYFPWQRISTTLHLKTSSTIKVHKSIILLYIFQGFVQWDKSLLNSYFYFDAYVISQVHKKLFVNMHNTICSKMNIS